MHFLACCKRARGARRLPYEDSDRKTLMKQAFNAFSCLNLRMAELLHLFYHIPFENDMRNMHSFTQTVQPVLFQITENPIRVYR